MFEIPLPVLMALLGFIGGGILGFTARTARFCTFGAIEDACLGGDFKRLRAWLFAIAVAIICTQLLSYFNIVDLSLSFHLRPALTWLSLIIGGLCFGFGMAQTGTCPYGALVRLGTGDMRALVTLLVIGITGYMTMRGLTAYTRLYLLDPVQIEFAQRGAQSLPALLGATEPASVLVVAILLALIPGIWALKSRNFRKSGINVAAGLIIGLTVSAGWLATGYFGNDEFSPQPVVSFGFISAMSNALIYLMTFSGATINFSIATIGGVVTGSFIGSCAKKEFKLEAFDDAREMRRYLLGATLMGFGGITALGCTIGQGITGLSTLSVGSLIAILAIGLGAVLGLYYLVEDSWRETFIAIFRSR